MRLLDHDDTTPADRPGRSRPLVAGLLVLLAVGGALWWRSSRDGAPPEAPSAASAPAESVPRAAPPPAPATAMTPAPSSRPGTRRREGAEPAARSEPSAPEPAGGPELRVTADVDGASVFVDRKYVGTTPLVTRDVAPGTHQLNVSADGEESVVQTIEVGPAEPTSVSVRLREVRLDASVPVVHKHGVGSCEGRLVATPAGLRYATSNAKDGFTLPFGSLEVFRVDYLEKHLQVKQRGGRTWNFTTKSESADPLFVFHRDVEKARARLAKQ